MKYPKLEQELFFRGIKKCNLARALGFTRPAPLTKRLNGEIQITLEEAFIIADYLGKSVDELFREEK